MVLAWKAGVVQATGGSNPPLSAIFYLSDEKRPSAALPLLHVNDVPGGTSYSVKLRAPSIWAFLISPDISVDQIVIVKNPVKVAGRSDSRVPRNGHP